MTEQDRELVDELEGELSVFTSFCVARQPIVDRRRRLFAYELLFRDGIERDFARVEDPDQATLSVAASGFVRALSPETLGTRAFINFGENLLLSGLPRALPSATTVVEVLEDVRPSPEVLAALDALRQDGYLVALDDYVGEGGEEFLGHVDIVKIDVLALGEAQLTKLVRALERYPVRLLAEKVEDQATFRRCRQLGFSLFQGYHFARPEVLTGRELGVTTRSRLELLERVQDPSMSIEELVTLLRQEVALNVRLLRYLASASFGFVQPIRSIRQAVVMLGERQLRHWLRMVLLVELAEERLSVELCQLCLLRARFFEQLCIKCGKSGSDAESLFTLGLLSLIDVLLQRPMAEVAPELPLPQSYRDAYCGVDNEEARWLALARALELAEFGVADELARCLGCAPEDVRDAYNIALEWSVSEAGALMDAGSQRG